MTVILQFDDTSCASRATTAASCHPTKLRCSPPIAEPRLERLSARGLAGLDRRGGGVVFDPAARGPALDQLAAARLEVDAYGEDAGSWEPVLDLAGCRRTRQAGAQQARVGGELGRQRR